MVQPTGVGVRRELGRRPSTDVDALHAVGRDVLEAVGSTVASIKVVEAVYTSSAAVVALEAVDVLLDVVADLLEVGKARELDHRRRAADEDHLPCEGGGCLIRKVGISPGLPCEEGGCLIRKEVALLGKCAPSTSSPSAESSLPSIRIRKAVALLGRWGSRTLNFIAERRVVLAVHP